jgi:putative spermidine/putrescine transport system substrate-binding protein
MRKIAFNMLALFALASFVLSACGGAATQKPVASEAPVKTQAPVATKASSATEAPATTSGEGEVAIVAWPGYIERGANDPKYDWVTGFEKETGCKVTVKEAGTSDEMVQLVNSGGFDLVTASGDASLRLIYGK